MNTKIRLSVICIALAEALSPLQGFAADWVDPSGPCTTSPNAVLSSDTSNQIADDAQIATAVALASDPGNIALKPADLSKLTPVQLKNLYSRADHFDDLAQQTEGTPASRDFSQAASDIRAAQTSQQVGDEQGFEDHMKNIVHIFGKSWEFMLQPGPLMALGVGALGYAATHGGISEQSDAYFNNPKHKWTGADYQVGNLMGQGLLLVPWIAVGALTDNTQMNNTTDQLLAGGLTNLILTESLKYAVNQPRPYGGNYGFPSGHASFSFMMATVVAENYGWKAAIPAYLLATYVGVSRVEGDMHTPAQVIAGAAIGTAAGIAASQAYASEHKFTIAPGLVNGAPGIVFQKTLDAN